MYSFVIVQVLRLKYMCIEYNECHYGGMYNVYVKEFLLLQKNCAYE